MLILYNNSARSNLEECERAIMNSHNSRIRIPVTVNGEEAIPEQIEAQDELNETQETGCAELEEELEAAQQEANDYKDKYLRAQAEMANFKKRLERRYEEQVEEEKKHLLLKFLSVADNLERALNHGDLSDDGLRDGIQLTYQELQHLLAQEGVEQIEPEGQPFDPSYHEAVAIVPNPEAEADTVVAEVQKGYLYRDQLLRPAKVHVAGAPKHE
jgi:molecular chaperone GrpE